MHHQALYNTNSKNKAITCQFQRMSYFFPVDPTHTKNTTDVLRLTGHYFMFAVYLVQGFVMD